jgi:hypothetical protein
MYLLDESEPIGEVIRARRREERRRRLSLKDVA